MIKKISLFLLVFSFASNAWCAPIPDSEKEGSAYVVYDAILYFTDKNQANPQKIPFSIGGLIVALVQNGHPTSRKLLVDLYDFYLGSAYGAQLDVMVTNYGNKIINYLITKIGSSSACKAIDRSKLQNIRCSNEKKRDERIKRMIDVIKSGKPYDYIP